MRNKASTKVNGNGPELPNVVHVSNIFDSSVDLLPYKNNDTTLPIMKPNKICTAAAIGNNATAAALPDSFNFAQVLATLTNSKHGCNRLNINFDKTDIADLSNIPTLLAQTPMPHVLRSLDTAANAANVIELDAPAATPTVDAVNTV